MTDVEPKAPAYQWYARDFAADELVQLMTLEEEGAYRRLLDHQWLHGSIPADVAQIARICKNMPVRRMQKLWAAIGPCFVPAADDPSRLQNRRLERERAKSQEYRDKQTEKGKHGAEVRWERERARREREAQEQAQARAFDSPGNAPAMPAVCPDDGSAVCSLPSAGTTPLSPARVEAFRRVPGTARDAVTALADASPDPAAWAIECVAWLDGMRTGQPTPEQLNGAIREFLHDVEHNEKPFDMSLFRGYVRNAGRARRSPASSHPSRNGSKPREYEYTPTTTTPTVR